MCAFSLRSTPGRGIDRGPVGQNFGEGLSTARMQLRGEGLITARGVRISAREERARFMPISEREITGLNRK